MSDPLHKMRELLRCGAPVHALRTGDAPDDSFVAAYHANQEVINNVPAASAGSAFAAARPLGDWASYADPANKELVSAVTQYTKEKNRLLGACWAFDRICNDVVRPQRRSNLQWQTLDLILSHMQTQIPRMFRQLYMTESFFEKKNGIDSVNRRFWEEKGRLEERNLLLNSLLLNAQQTLQELYVDTGLYTAQNLINSSEDFRPRTEQKLWDWFCGRMDQL